MLVGGCSDPNAHNEKGQTPLLLAAEAGDLKAVRSLLKRGAQVNLYDLCHWSPLLKAAAKGHGDIVRYLLAHGANPNDADEGAYTALMQAAGNDHAEVVDILLSHHATVDAVESTLGWTALIWAAREGHTAPLASLLSAGADVEIGDINGETALVWSVRRGHINAVRQLIAHDANPMARGRFGKSTLVLAAEQDNLPLLEILVSALKTSPGHRTIQIH